MKPPRPVRSRERASQIVTVRIPMAFRKRGGRRLMIVPGDAATPQPPKSTVDNPVLKAIIRAHRWQRLLEAGEFASIAELAVAENVDRSYMSKVLRLTLLAPDLVAEIIAHSERSDFRVDRLFTPLPGQWERQRQIFSQLEGVVTPV